MPGIPYKVRATFSDKYGWLNFLACVISALYLKDTFVCGYEISN